MNICLSLPIPAFLLKIVAFPLWNLYPQYSLQTLLDASAVYMPILTSRVCISPPLSVLATRPSSHLGELQVCSRHPPTTGPFFSLVFIWPIHNVVNSYSSFESYFNNNLLKEVFLISSSSPKFISGSIIGSIAAIFLCMQLIFYYLKSWFKVFLPPLCYMIPERGH